MRTVSVPPAASASSAAREERDVARRGGRRSRLRSRRGAQSAGIPAGATTTGHGAPCASRSAVVPGARRPSGPRAVEPTTTSEAPSRVASSCSTRAAEGPPATMRSASVPAVSFSSRASAASRRSVSTVPPLTALLIGIVQVRRDRDQRRAGDPRHRRGHDERGGVVALWIEADDDGVDGHCCGSLDRGREFRRDACFRRAPARHRVIATRVLRVPTVVPARDHRWRAARRARRCGHDSTRRDRGRRRRSARGAARPPVARGRPAAPQRADGLAPPDLPRALGRRAVRRRPDARASSGSASRTTAASAGSPTPSRRSGPSTHEVVTPGRTRRSATTRCCSRSARGRSRRCRAR